MKTYYQIWVGDYFSDAELDSQYPKRSLADVKAREVSLSTDKDVWLVKHVDDYSDMGCDWYRDLYKNGKRIERYY